jgi:hypothetical protein
MIKMGKKLIPDEIIDTFCQSFTVVSALPTADQFREAVRAMLMKTVRMAVELALKKKISISNALRMPPTPLGKCNMELLGKFKYSEIIQRFGEGWNHAVEQFYQHIETFGLQELQEMLQQKS